MNSKHRKTLTAVFKTPTPKNVVWSDIEALLLAVGCVMLEGDGSRVSFKKGEFKADFHRPHPGKEAKPYQVRDARSFLERIGARP